MTSVFTARRRAEEFNSLVEQDSTREAPPARLAGYVELVDQLRAVPTPEPRPEFTASLRTELLDAADSLLVPSGDTQRLSLPTRTRTRDRRVAVAVGAVAVLGATSSLAVAAQSALPGDLLYPLKRAIESAETGLHSDDATRGTALLSHASDRLDEAVALSRTGDLGEGPYVETALRDFTDQATTASDLLLADQDVNGDDGSVQALRDFTAASMDTLGRLEAQLPEAARDELRHAAQVLTEIDAAAERACPACRGGIDRIPSVLLSAGQAAGTDTVVVPGNLLPEQDATRTGGKGDNGGRERDGSGGGGPALPDVEGVTGGAGSGTGDAPDSGNGPLQDLTDGLTGQDGGQASNDGLTGVPGIDDTVDDVVEGVDEVLPDVLP